MEAELAPESAAPLTELGFPEALRWRGGALWFSDMFRGRVLSWVPGSPAKVVLDVVRGGPDVPGGLGWLPDGRLLVVDCTQRRVLRLDADGTLAVHADLTDVFPHPANDMHVDPDGTAWVGSYGFDPSADNPVASPLARISPAGAVTTTDATFIFPNGCERDPDGNLIVAETFADRVSVLEPSGRTHVLADLPPGSGPDGLTIAKDGTVYVALAFAGAIAEIRPRSGGADVHLIASSAPITEGPGAGPTGIYDCALHTDGRTLAFASASLDEPLAERVDTGSVTLMTVESAGA